VIERREAVDWRRFGSVGTFEAVRIADQQLRLQT
jgi:hypothetical protein